MGRAPCCDKASVKRGPWSPEEDSKLKEYIEKHGTGGNWIALPQKAGLKRCGKSCRLRWLNYLRPNIKHGEFSDDEDRIICSLYANIGSRWSIIAAQLPGRTDNDIKNYWNTKLKKKLMALLPPSSTITHHQLRKSPYHHQSLSSPQNPPLAPSLSPSVYTDYYSSSYYSTNPPPTISFSGLEPISVHSGTFTNTCCTTTSNTTTSLPSLYQNQQDHHLVSSSSSSISPMQLQYYYPNSMRESSNNNMFMFGSSDQGSCSSSDGSCSQVSRGCRENNNNIKQEEMAFQNYMSKFEEYNSINQWTEIERTTTTGMDYELEVIKQLISSNIDGYSSVSGVDENKTTGEKLGMYNYYY